MLFTTSGFNYCVHGILPHSKLTLMIAAECTLQDVKGVQGSTVLWPKKFHVKLLVGSDGVRG